MATGIKDKVAIIGMGCTRFGERWDMGAEELMVEAFEECLADADVRERRREREAARRAQLDEAYVARFAQRIREIYPRCPESLALAIAEHACLKMSGRVGRSAAAKQLDAEAVRLAVVAHVRHAQTDYDALLARGDHADPVRSRLRRGDGVDRAPARDQLHTGKVARPRP